LIVYGNVHSVKFLDPVKGKSAAENPTPPAS